MRLAERLRREFPADIVAAAFTLAELRRRAARKFSRADQMWFTREGLEQASSEALARHHAARFAGRSTLVDLCTGIGGDLSQLRADVAVDRDPLHLRLALLNAEVYGARVEGLCDDVRHVSLDRVSAAFVDPARRTHGRGRARLGSGASEPPLEWCLGLAERVSDGAVGIKAAPGLPHQLVPNDWEAEFISDDDGLKTCTLWSPRLATTRRRATLLHTCLSIDSSIDGEDVPIQPPGAYLLDPDPAVTRAGLVEQLACSLAPPVWKIDAQIAFLSSDQLVQTPFARTLRIDASLPWNLKRLRELLRARHVGVVDIRKRGSAVDVDDLRARLRLHGEQAATVVLTRVQDKPWAMVCHDP